MLERVATAWKENHDKIVEQGGQIVAALRESQSVGAGEGKIDAAVLEAAYKQLDHSYDPKEGGFGNAPKFPRPVTVNFLTRFYARDPKNDADKQALEMALFTLRKMAAGGMHDHIGGGFHRYSSKKCSTIRRSSQSLIWTRSKSQETSNTNQSRAIFLTTSAVI
ncbi:MAG: hypothetical protein DME39_05975 [Verrucomicrobia bacterium]|nr:MAG: hypothetical protein DME39_05975 [Verrucomicrobiota bacterium]